MIHRIFVVTLIALACANIYSGEYSLASHQAFIALLCVWSREDAEDATMFRAMLKCQLKFIPMPGHGTYWVESQSGDGCSDKSPREAIIKALQDVER